MVKIYKKSRKSKKTLKNKTHKRGGAWYNPVDWFKFKNAETPNNNETEPIKAPCKKYAWYNPWKCVERDENGQTDTIVDSAPKTDTQPEQNASQYASPDVSPDVSPDAPSNSLPPNESTNNIKTGGRKRKERKNKRKSNKVK
jgi:hypothetical protein